MKTIFWVKMKTVITELSENKNFDEFHLRWWKIQNYRDRKMSSKSAIVGFIFNHLKWNNPLLVWRMDEVPVVFEYFGRTSVTSSIQVLEHLFLMNSKLFKYIQVVSECLRILSRSSWLCLNKTFLDFISRSKDFAACSAPNRFKSKIIKKISKKES